MTIVAEDAFAADAPSLTRRGLFGFLPALALGGRAPVAPPRPTRRNPFPAVEPPDQMARLAHHYVSVVVRMEALNDDWPGAAAEAEYDGLDDARKRAEKALYELMTERGVAAFTTGGRVFANIQRGMNIPDCPQLVEIFNTGGEGDPAAEVPWPAPASDPVAVAALAVEGQKVKAAEDVLNGLLATRPGVGVYIDGQVYGDPCGEMMKAVQVTCLTPL